MSTPVPDLADHSDGPHRPSLRRTWPLWLLAGWGWLQLIVGLTAWLTVRDAVPYLATIFYASPLVLLAADALFLAAVHRLAGHTRLAAGLLAAAAGLGVWWHAATYYRNEPPPTSDGDVRILLWNIQYLTHGWEPVLEEIHRHDPDVIALVEVTPGAPDGMLDMLQNAFPEYEMCYAWHGLMFVKGTFLRKHDGGLVQNDQHYGRYADMAVKLDAGPEFNAVLVDFDGDPLVSRGPAFEGLAEVLAWQSDRPLMVLGDFNTPAKSVWFDPYRQQLENAFETAGQGYFVTWPVGLPVLAIDHVWLPPGVVRSCQLLDTNCSDHRLILVETNWDAHP